MKKEMKDVIDSIRKSQIEEMAKQNYIYKGIIALDGIKYDWFSWQDDPDQDIIIAIDAKKLKKQAKEILKQNPIEVEKIADSDDRLVFRNWFEQKEYIFQKCINETLNDIYQLTIIDNKKLNEEYQNEKPEKSI